MRTSEALAPARRPKRWRPRRLVAVALPLALLGVGGAGVARSSAGPRGEDGGDPVAGERLSIEEVPAEVLDATHRGDGSVASFGRFLGTVRSFHHGHPAPRPADLAGLRAATAASAAGVVGAVRLESELIELGELRAARIDLIIDLRDVVTFDAPDDVSTTSWTRTVWSGDPVLLDAIVHRLRTELGPGPLGAQAVLFGNITDTPEGPVLGVFDGLVDDGVDVARLSVVVPAPSGELRTAASVIQQMGG